MAIQAQIKISENVSIPAYIKVSVPRSYKVIEEEKPILKINYSLEYYSEKDGSLLKSEIDNLTNYGGGDIWAEAYADAKLKFINPKDV